jgi:hypothetical protein
MLHGLVGQGRVHPGNEAPRLGVPEMEELRTGLAQHPGHGYLRILSRNRIAPQRTAGGIETFDHQRDGPELVRNPGPFIPVAGFGMNEHRSR